MPSHALEWGLMPAECLRGNPFGYGDRGSMRHVTIRGCAAGRAACKAAAQAPRCRRGGSAMVEDRNNSPRAGVVGAAIVPHAPQFLTLPDTEDKAQVARVNAAMSALGERFRALGSDLLIVLSN